MKPAPHCLPSIVLRAARRLGVATLLALSMVPPALAIIHVPPVVTSIARLQPGPVTTANTLTWRVTFNMTVNGVDSSDFTLTPVDGSATGTLSSVAAGSSAAEYIVTATGVSGTGTLRLDVNASGTDIIGGLDDLPLTSGFTLGQPYTHTSAYLPVAWGWNQSGQLGNNLTTSSPVPVDVLGTGALAGKTVVALATGYQHSLALCSDGTVAAWGSNMSGQLGNNSWDGSPVPVAVNTESGTSALAGKTVVAVAAGGQYSLALCSDGTVTAWGWNEHSQLGNATTTTSPVPVAVNTDSGMSALSGKKVVAVAAGDLHALALCSDGTVAAWGSNATGPLGNATTTDSPVPVAVSTASALSGKTVVAVSAGGTHSLALCNDGTVAAWGNNGSGRLGNNSTTNSPVPVAVNTASGTSALAGKTVVAVSAGLEHSLALCSDGTAVAWGVNWAGQLGNGSTTDSLVPVAVNTASSSALSGRTVSFLGTGGVAYHTLVLASPSLPPPATVTAVSAPVAGSYKAGDTLSFTLTTSAAATVATTGGTPRLALTIGMATRYATCASGTGTTSLVFTYTVQVGDTDADGIAIASTIIELDGGTIVDAWDTPITLVLPAYTLPTIKVDTTAPDTTLDTKPANPSASASATFTFSSADASASFVASLDGAAYTPATSPATFTGLADGSHTFSVRAIDAAGNVDATPASFTWTVDSTAPDAPTIVSISSTSIAGTAEAGSTVRVYAGATLLGTTTADGSGDWSLVVTLADGAYSLTATATDSANNTTSTSGATTRTIDTTAPTLTAVTLVSSNVAPALAKVGDTLTLTFKPSESLQTPTVTLAGASATATYDSVSATWSATHTVAAGDTEGTATFSIAFRDLAGNAGTSVATTSDSSAVTIDRTAPETALVSTPATLSDSRTATFTFSSIDGTASFEASLDSAAYTPATSPHTLTGLADGSHTFSVRAIDAAGNVDATPASFTWTVDSTAPTAPTIASVSSTSIAGTAEAGSTVRVYAGATLLGPTTADGSGDWSLVVTLADGAYSLTATATDSANNTTSTSGATTRTIDTTAPTLTAVTLVSSNVAPALAKVGDTLTLTFKPSESLQTPTVTLAGASATATYDSVSATWSATHTVAAGDTEGTVTFSIAFRDLAGNAGTSVATTSDSSAVTIDRTAPETALVSTPATLSDSRTATFTFSSADASASFAASLDGAAYTPATSPATFTGLADGSHTFSVRAIDAAGNVDATPASFTWSVDSTAPTAPTIVSISSTSIAGTAEAGSTVRVYAGATLLGTTTADGSGNWSLAVTLADGAYSLTATATDSANNTTSTSGATTRTIDTTAPTVPTGLSGRATSSTTVALVWTASIDAGGVTGYRIHRNGAVIATSAATAYSDTALTAGTAYTYTVTAYDAAGHESAASAPATATTQLSGAQRLDVATTDELLAALASATANPSATYTITVAAGTYTPTTGLTIGTSGLTLEGAGTLSGSGLTSGALLTLSGDSIVVSGLTFANGTVSILAGADHGAIDECTFLAAGITGTGGTGWSLTGNSFSDTTGAALTFTGAADLVLADNVVVDCAQAFVLSNLASPKVRNNFIANNSASAALASLVLTDVSSAQIDHNTVYQAGTATNAIEYSGSAPVGAIRNNLANKPIAATGSATATLATNCTTAAANWFRAPADGDLHLVATRSEVVGAATALADLAVDIDGDPRPTGSAADIGADEFQPDTAAPSVPTGLSATVRSSSQATLSWTGSTDSAPSGVPASGVAGYRIYRNGTAIGTSTTASYADAGLSAGTTYTYTVTAYDGAANESAASAAVSATTTTVAPTDTGKKSGGGGACGPLFVLALGLAAFWRRRFVRR